MRPSAAIKSGRSRVLQTITKYGLSNPRIFGSTLRGDDSDDSDLDLLVDAGEETSLLDMVKAQHEIEDALGVSVDLLTPEDLPESFRKKVLSEAAPV
ncbi:MAG: nucleotidyltransferase [Nitrospirales bacterium]|nr:nucleotidyltransferase [Nitrospirales bacterium]